jgi:hypothetical protein
MAGFKPILGLCSDVFRAACTVVNIDFQPLGLKSDRKQGGEESRD